MEINLKNLKKIRKVIVYNYIYNTIRQLLLANFFAFDI